MLSYKDTKLKRRKRGRQDRCKQIYRVSRQGASFRRANRRSAEYSRIWQVARRYSTFIAGLIYFFGAKAFLILAIVIVKIIYLGFLASRTSEVALIMWISKALSRLQSSIVSYIVPYLILGSVLGTELILDLGLGSLSILFIVKYQSFQYFYIVSLSFYLARGSIVLRVYLQGLVKILDL